MKSGFVGIQRTFGHPAGATVVELKFQLLALAEHPDGQAVSVNLLLGWIRAEIGKRGQVLDKKRLFEDHRVNSISSPFNLRNARLVRRVLTINTRPPCGLVQASAVKTGGTTSSSSERISAQSPGSLCAQARRSEARAESTIFSVGGSWLICCRSVFGRWIGGRTWLLSGKADIRV